jgi:hypothetical protein
VVTVDYEDFVERRRHDGADGGFGPVFMPDALFDFQRSLVEWSLRKGRAAVFADCGLGKTPMQLTWAENVARKAGRPVLVLTPLAVGPQTVREGEKFGVECVRSGDGAVSGRVVVTNYERLSMFRPAEFAGVACDESSILKSFDGARRNEITDFMRKVPYRLLCTATAAPNDYLELGTSSEALGYLGHMDMLNRFFVNDSSNSATRRQYGEAPKWRFKGHAVTPFWRWVASWARACRKPSDLGFDDGRFVLPPLTEATHVVKASVQAPGDLFVLPAARLDEQREERKRTVSERCEKAAALAGGDDQALVWCHLNEEGDLLERLIPGAIQVSGSDSDAAKEDKFLAFADGKARVLVTKPKIGAWGLNFQRCARIVYFPSHSFESYYQAVRRCWRFGQTRPVHVDLVLTEGELRVMDNLKRKAEAASAMFSALVAEMNQATAVSKPRRDAARFEVPAWIR